MVNGVVSSFAVQGDGKVLIGGDFTTANGVPGAYIARLRGNADVPPPIKSISQSGPDVDLSWHSISNRTYRVQNTGGLLAKNRMDLAGDVSATGATTSKTDTTLGDDSRRFYRVALLP